jgi:hypothetical protein
MASRFVEFFGPCTWKTMHSVAFNYANDPFHPSPEEQKAATDFFGSMSYLIPCAKCRGHYEEYIKKHPIDADSRESLSRWVYDLHSDVNRRRHVKNISYEEVKDDYLVWSREKMEKYMKMGTQERLRKLADPHFGRKIQTHGTTEQSMGILDGIGTDKILALVIGGAIVGGLIYYVSRKGKEEEQINTNQK